MAKGRLILFAILLLLAPGIESLKCVTSVTYRAYPGYETQRMHEFVRFVADREEDGINGYCDSASDSSPVCLTMVVRGQTVVDGYKRADMGGHRQAYGFVEVLTYKSCDFGLVVRQDNRYAGWVCQSLEGAYPRSWVDRPPSSSCYHWDRVRNTQYGTPDIHSGTTSAGYRFTIYNASLTIHCCRNGDNCNQNVDNRQCESKPYPFDQIDI